MFDFNFHVHINPEYIIFSEIKYILIVISWCLLVDLKEMCNTIGGNDCKQMLPCSAAFVKGVFFKWY